MTRVPSSYRAMPTSPNVIDQRNAPYDYRSALRAASPRLLSSYADSPLGGVTPNPLRSSDSDPMLNAGDVARSNVPSPLSGTPYPPSFNPRWRPPYTEQAPYRPSLGPWLPSGPTGTSLDPEMPYISPHLPISPGDPGWTPPTSVGGASKPISLLMGADPSMTFIPGMTGLLGR